MNVEKIKNNIEIDDEFRQAVYIINNHIMDKCSGVDHYRQSNVIGKWKKFLESIDYDAHFL